jgi:hypothetical protein
MRANDQKRVDHERALSQALASKLNAEQENDQYIYQQMQDLLTPRMLAPAKQQQVIELLSSAKTRKAMETILSLLAYPEYLDETKQLRDRLAEALINPTSGLVKNSPLHADVSALLERAWYQTNDDVLQASIAVGVANIGTPSGVRWFTKVLNEVDRLDDAQHQDTLTRMLIPAMEKIQSPEAVPILLDNMQKYNPDNRILEGSGYALAHFNQPEAARALVDWSVNAPAVASDMVGNWFQIIGTHDSELLRSLQDDVKRRRFRSEQVRKVILSINVPRLEEW